MTESRAYVPAAGRDWLLPFYDPLLRLLGDAKVKQAFIESADIRPGHRVLDLGCGTGNLALQIHAHCPGAEVVGIDPDPLALARAREKSARAGAKLTWQPGSADALPFEDGRFDRIVSSLVFHHLKPDVVRATIPEVRRVLAPGGTVAVLDFSHGGSHGLHGLVAKFASHQHGEEDVAGELTSLFRAEGLIDAEAAVFRRTLLGALQRTSASAPL